MEMSVDYYRECQIAGAGSVEVDVADDDTTIVSATRYLPADATGARCLQLLMRAFDQGVAFRVGSSTTTGRENTVVWSIHQKTRYNGGEVHHGWPDPGYVDRLTSECAANNVSVD